MLTDEQLSVLRDIGEGSSFFEEEKKHEVVNLLVRGYIERDGSLFRVSKAGEAALRDAMQVGTNFERHGGRG
jgi:hypothetical protein